MIVPPETVAARLASVRASTRQAGVDALVVTHLPNVQYLTGFTGSAGVVIVLPTTCLLVVDFRYVTAANELTAGLDGHVTMATFERSYDEALVDLLRRHRSLRIGVEAAYLPVSRFNAMSAGLAAWAPLPDVPPALVATERLVERARIIKDGVEIQTLREAGRRLGRIARDVPGFVREGRTERSVAAEIESAMREAGFSRPAFETIVASGPNSVLPHARPTDRAIQGGDPTVLDFGGVYDGYCVDLTRTVQLGAASAALQQLYVGGGGGPEGGDRGRPPGRGVQRHRRRGPIRARAVRPRRRRSVTGPGTASGSKCTKSRGSPGSPPRLPDHVVEPGMVFTIEPGAYVPGVGGVRMEDDVLVTDTGCEV